MLWFEILGWVFGYFLLGIIAVRLIYMISEDKDEIKEYSGVIYALWPIALLLFGMNALSKAAFKWTRDD